MNMLELSNYYCSSCLQHGAELQFVSARMPGSRAYQESWIPLAGMLAGIIIVLVANVTRRWKAERKRMEARAISAAAAAAARQEVNLPPSSQHESLRARVAARRQARTHRQLANDGPGGMNRRLPV